jgi:sugar lactone lactonase YvrE
LLSPLLACFVMVAGSIPAELSGQESRPLIVVTDPVSFSNYWTGGIGVDAAGNLYLAENTRIWRLPAGSSQGSIIAGATASLPTVRGLAVTPAGLSIWTAANHTVNRLTPSGAMSVLAGAASAFGYVDGPAEQARFNQPSGVAVDAAGNIYVADSGNHVIRKIDSNGVVSTFVGRAGLAGWVDGLGDTARFQAPLALAIDSEGNLYVSEQNRPAIRRVTPSGEVSTFAGGPIAGWQDGIGGEARFNNPIGLAASQGYLYVFEAGSRMLRRISASRQVVTMAGSLEYSPQIVDGAGSMVRFQTPYGIAARSDGTLFLADNYHIRRAIPDGVPAAPVIAVQPANATGALGRSITLSVMAYATPAPTYVWRKNGSPVLGAIGPTLNLENLTSTDAGDYTVVVTNVLGSVTSQAATLSLVSVPANDAFASRATLTGAVASAVTSYVGAAREPGEPQHNGTGQGASLWWTWTAPSTGFVTVDASTSSVASVARVYTGSSLDGLVGVPSAAAYAATNSESRRTFAAIAGTSYQIAMEPALGAVPGEAKFTLGYAYTIQGIAGSMDSTSTSGSDDGTGSAARFGGAAGIVRDSSGNFFVADSDYHTIRRVTPAGVVTTFAGMAGQPGTANGTGSAARFNYPIGLAIDSSGNLYVSDGGNHAIRKISPAGVVSTLAGLPGTSGMVNATGTSARFDTPRGIAIDAAGNLYVADLLNHLVRRVTAAGAVTTVAGQTGIAGTTDGVGTAATLYYPLSLALSGSTLYLGDISAEARLRVINTANAAVTTLVYSSPPVSSPTAMTVDPTGHIYLAAGETIHRVSPNGVGTRIAGTSGGSTYLDGDAMRARIGQPFGLAFDPSGNLWIAARSSIRKATVASQPMAPIVFSAPTGLTVGVGSPATLSLTAFGSPTVNYQWTKNLEGIPGANGPSLFIPAAAINDSGSYAVTVSNASGAVTPPAVELTVLPLAANDAFSDAVSLTGSQSLGSGHNFNSTREVGEPVLHANAAGRSVWWKWTAPQDGMAVVDAGGSSTPVWLGAYRGNALAALEALGTAQTASNGDAARVYFNAVAGSTYFFAIDSIGAAEGRLRLQLNYAHTATNLAGAAAASGSADGVGSDARFFSPTGIARDAQGVLYVADSSNRVIRKIAADGVVSTVAGTAGQSGNVDGLGSAARFTNPAGIALDGSGNLYVTDASAHTVRKIAPDGEVTTLAGLAASAGGGSGSADGVGSAARFNQPRGIALGSDGALYVADAANRAIRRVTLDGVVTTFAGAAGSSGNLDGIGSAARFNFPRGIAASPDGHLYVADSGNRNIRRVAVPSAEVTTVAGSPTLSATIDGIGVAVGFSSPFDLSADAAGNLYIVDSTARVVRKLSPNGHVVTVAGLPSAAAATVSGSGPVARFSTPAGIAVAPDGTAFVVDQTHHIVRRVAPSYLPQAPFITSTPANQVVLAGQAVSVEIGVTAAPAAQAVWQRNGQTLPSVTGSSLHLASAQAIDGGEYMVEFTNPHGSAVTQPFTLTVVQPGSNDHFANRMVLAGVPAISASNNFQASFEPGESPHFEASGGKSIWWTWTAPQSGKVIFDAVDSSIETMVAAYTGSSVSQLSLVQSDLARVSFTAQAGTVYQIAVDGRAGATGNITLRVSYAFDAPIAASGFAARGMVMEPTGSVLFADASHTIRRMMPSGAVSIVAGAANLPGSADGLATEARFNDPCGLALASDGTIYVSELNNHTIRKIAPDGTVSTVAGSPGLTGTANGVGAAARFNQPRGIALDAAEENLYVADFANYTIRRLALATGAVTTFAGSPGARATSSVNNGTGTAARFYNPASIARGSDNNFYVADQGIATIRRITPAGVVTTFAGTSFSAGSGDGPVQVARLTSQPNHLAFDSSGNLLVGDSHGLRLIGPTGGIVTVAGVSSAAGLVLGSGDSARFSGVWGIAIGPDGRGFLADRNNALIRRLEPANQPQAPRITAHPAAANAFAGSTVTLSVQAEGIPAVFTYQWFFGNDSIAGATGPSLVIPNIQLNQTGQYSVVVTNEAGSAASSSAFVAVSPRPSNDSFAAAAMLTGSAPAAMVSNVGASREAGEPLHGGNPGGASLWWRWTAPASGAVIADGAGSSIHPIIAVYSGTGFGDLIELASAVPTAPTSAAPVPRPPAAMFTAIEGTTYWIAMDGDFGATGNLALHLSFTYNFSTLAGLPGVSGTANGTGSAARFNRLNATAPDPQGNVFVADLNNHTIRRVTPEGVVTTIAGLGGTSGYVNGTGSAARFSSPAGIVYAADGFLYVADANNHAIRRVNPSTGAVTTFAGPTTATAGTADGAGTAARFNGPAAIGIEPTGSFLVAESNNHSIRRITTAAVVTTVAGLKGTSGAADGNGTAARFNTPEGVTADAQGIIYVADFRNHAVRRIALNGDVTTVAGALAVTGYIDGTVAQARLSGPNGVTALADGSVLIADYYNAALRTLTPDGYVLTLAGGNGAGHADGTGLGIKFNQPATIAADSNGRIYIADQGNHVVRRGIITSAAAAPEITKQPKSIRIIAGEPVTLTGSAIGNPFPTLQWKKGGENVFGATGESLHFANAQPSDSGLYTLVATNAYGFATSEVAVVEILPLPFNDNFRNRSRALGDSVALSAYNYKAEAEPGEPAHAGAAANRSVWFTWTAPATGDVTIDTIGSGFDTRLAVYRGDTLAALNLVGSSASESGLKFSKLRMPVAVGDTFQIAVDGLDGATGDFRLSIEYSWNFALYSGAVNTPGSVSGSLTQARYNFPAAAARDASGNLYIADTENHVIRRITAAGVVSVFAGTVGSSGTANGTGTAARFNRPFGVAVDGSGNVYVADTNNHAVRKITPAAAVSTLAGLPGTSGSVDGSGSAARFNNPTNLALDAAGNVFVTDYSNALIRKISAAGVVTTFAGTLNTFGNSPRYFNVPWGIAVDASGNVYVGDRADIRKIAPDGTASYFVGSENGDTGSADGLGKQARFNYPAQLAIDGRGNLYVADRMNHLIRRVSPNGEVRTIGGRPEVAGYLDGTAEVAVFGYPMAMAVDAGGFLYIGEVGTYLVRLGARQAGSRAPVIAVQPADQAGLAGSSVSLSVVATGLPAPTYQWRKNGTNIGGATGPVLALSNLTSGDAANYDVVVTNSQGSTTSRAAAVSLASVPANDHFANAAVLHGLSASATAFPVLASAEGGEPSHGGVAASRSLWWTWTAPAHGSVIVETTGSAADTRLAVYTGSALGALSLVAQNDDAIAGGGASRVQFQAAAGVTYRIAVDSYAGSGGIRLSVNYAMVVSTFAGSAGMPGTLDGIGSAARLSGPSGLARDAAGNLYISDSMEHVIRKVTPAGEVTVFAGAAGQAGSTNATGPAARFNIPFGLAIDASGNLYVADYGNRVIRRITPAGVVTTFAGTVGASGSVDGTGAAARFNLPLDLAIGPGGVLFVTDYGNHNLRRITLSTAAVTTLAGSAGNSGFIDGTGAAARFNGPRGAAADAAGNLYVADYFNHTVRRITSAGVVTTLAGFAGNPGDSDGAGPSARFNYPAGIAIDGTGRLFVAESSRLRRVSVDGIAATIAGGTTGSADGLAFSASFNGLLNIAIGPSGELFAADYFNHTVRLLMPSNLVASPQSIEFGPLSDRVFTLDPIALSATASSGLAVNFELVSGPATVIGSQLLLTGPGTVTVRATQAGNDAFLPAEPVERSFTVTANLLSWTVGRFTEAERADASRTGPAADFDGDGLPNLLEYALGLDPRVANATSGIAVSASGGNLVLTYTRPAARADLTFSVEASSSLSSWSSLGVTHEMVQASGETQTWRATFPMGPSRTFLRLKVSQP